MPYVWPVTLAEVKTDTNITSSADDTELQTFIDAATAMLENHPAYRVADAVASTVYTEWVDSSDVLILKHYPVTAVSSITEYTGTASQPIAHEPLDGGSFTGYGWDYQDGTGANGILVRYTSGLSTCWQGNRVKVVYTAGAASVPADLRLAALALVEHLWEAQRGGEGSGLPTGNELPETVGGGFTFESADLPPRVLSKLAPYRKAPAVA